MTSKLAIGRFRNLGFRWRSLRFSPIETNLGGKTVVITGVTGGLGKATAKALADMGAEVVIVGRSEEKLDRAAAEIGPRAIPTKADLSVMDEVRGLASGLLGTSDRLDVLINNVGVLLPERSETAEGLESTFATNVAGQFLVTNLLLPRLTESAPGRVVTVSSGGMYAQRLRPDDLETRKSDYTGPKAYARTKRAQVIITEEWARRFDPSEVVFHAMHPGWSATPGVADSLPAFNRIMKPLLRTPEQGADTIVWLAAADEPAEATGGSWFDRSPAPTHLTDSTVETEQDRALLWDSLANITQSDAPTRIAKRGPTNG